MLYIFSTAEKIRYPDEMEEVIIDLDRDGNIVVIEIIFASEEADTREVLIQVLGSG